MLHKIQIIQNVGRFEKALPTQNVRFEKFTMLYGENGWGKSTIADILRSLTNKDSSIILGRKTLAGGTNQKIVLKTDAGNATFENNRWNGATPRIMVFDSLYVNDNIYSGDTVSAEHLKRQYGLVVGEKGVRLVERIVELEEENTENNRKIRSIESELSASLRGIAPNGMTLAAFEELVDNPEIEDAIVKKRKQVLRIEKAKELKSASGCLLFPLPSESNLFKETLSATVEGIATAAADSVRAHVASHECNPAGDPSLENWLEIGLQYKSDETCPYCGQELRDRVLLDAYGKFFGESYRELAENVSKLRRTCERYINGEFGEACDDVREKNKVQFQYWKEAVGLVEPELDDHKLLVAQMVSAAIKMDKALSAKSSNLIVSIEENELQAVVEAWDMARAEIQNAIGPLGSYNAHVAEIKSTLDAGKLELLQTDLKYLLTVKSRFEKCTAEKILELNKMRSRKAEIVKQKSILRENLTSHGKTIMESLGKTINTYLKRLNAGFRIDYKEPDYRGKAPAASYRIIINDVPISPRVTTEMKGKPCFRNTLSAGDKSVLALALFLAQCNASPKIGDTIVVLDDPFTSLDNFRRHFTAIEIRRICGRAKQVIVMSHDKNFLRLLWDKIDHKLIASFALQTGAPGITTITPYDIEGSTQPRHITERMKIEEFIEGETHEPSFIRSRLRTVCEDFYRKADPSLFAEAATLDQIIRALAAAPSDHPFSNALENLKDINEYSRVANHAEVDGDPYIETNPDELKGFCDLVLNLTRGM